MKARSRDDAAQSSQGPYEASHESDATAAALGGSEEAAASLSALSAMAGDLSAVVGDRDGTSPRRQDQGRRNSESDHAAGTKVSGEESSDTSSRADSEARAPKGKMLAPLAPRTQETDNFGAWPAKAPSPATPTSSKASAQQRQRCPPLRKGKWTIEEEMYTSAIIREFERGMLNCAPGTTLRSFLSEKLHCDPMRITKKFAGDASIGKRVFTPCKHTAESAQEIARVRAELNDMERRFIAHLQRSNFAFGAGGMASKTRRTSSSNSLVSASSSPKPAAQQQVQQSGAQQQSRYAAAMPPKLGASTGPGGGGGRSGSPTGSSSSSAGLLHRPATSVKHERMFDSPLAVDHTGAFVNEHDLAPTPARRRSYDLDQSDGGPDPPYRPRSNTVGYGGEDADYGYGQPSSSKRYRKSTAANNYRVQTDNLQAGLAHLPPPPIHQASRDHHSLFRHHPGLEHARQPPASVEAAKPEESQLLLDFFVKVHERCNTDDAGAYGDDARAGRAAKRARSVV